MNFTKPEKDTLKEEMQRQNFVKSLVTNFSTKSNPKVDLSATLRNMINVDLRSKREVELQEKVNALLDKISHTENEIKESQKNQKDLTEKINSLEKAIFLHIVMSDHPSETSVKEFSKLVHESGERIKKTKELEYQEKQIHESFSNIEKLLSSNFSSGSF